MCYKNCFLDIPYQLTFLNNLLGFLYFFLICLRKDPETGFSKCLVLYAQHHPQYIRLCVCVCVFVCVFVYIYIYIYTHTHTYMSIYRSI